MGIKEGDDIGDIGASLPLAMPNKQPLYFKRRLIKHKTNDNWVRMALNDYHWCIINKENKKGLQKNVKKILDPR